MEDHRPDRPSPLALPDSAPRAPLSAVVVSYNRAAIIGTCLRALAFADEVIVIDKSSTDATADIAARHADRVIVVPWSPTADDTRAFAVAQCRHDWILCIDDDECLNAAAVLFIDAELRAPRADIYYIPLRHYVLGVHDPGAYYWPEAHPRLFRRDAVRMAATIHGGFQPLSDSIFAIPVESGPCIHHLSHVDAAQWIEKTNRYTAMRDRNRDRGGAEELVRYAHEQIDLWAAKGAGPGEPYREAVAMLRAVYAIVDRIKAWEQSRDTDGNTLFAEACARLDTEYAKELGAFARPFDAAPTA